MALWGFHPTIHHHLAPCLSNFSAFIVVLLKLSFDFWSWVLNLSSSSSHVMERESLCDQDILCWYPEISISESSSGDSVYRQYGDLSRRTVTNAEDEASVSVTGVTFTMLCMLTAARRCCTSWSLPHTCSCSSYKVPIFPSLSWIYKSISFGILLLREKSPCSKLE